MEIISRKEARERGLKRYFTGKPCKNGHVAERFVSNWACATCIATFMKDHNRKWYAKNREKKKERSKEWYAKNREKARDRRTERNLKSAATLDDMYIKRTIARATCAGYTEVTLEAIELKREQLKIHRLLRELKNGLNGKRNSRTEGDDKQSRSRDNQTGRG